jgi:hypothetical protein
MRFLRARTLAIAGGLVLAAAALALVSNPGYYLGSAYSGELCGSCHVIQPSVRMWRVSSHRDLDCRECHGSALTLDIETHRTHWRRLYLQLTGNLPSRVVLPDRRVDDLTEQCARCHQAAHALWRAGGHSMKYADVFLNPDQNRRTPPHDDCLRCHGMFYDGGDVGTLVQPLDQQGPWRLVDPRLHDRPAIPCLACHQVHIEGTPAEEPHYARPDLISYRREVRTYSLAFYDRRESMYFPTYQLPMPQMWDGERPVVMSPDRRQALCYQCHAPEATFQVGTADDRTGIGVHEGISCLGCHAAHSLDARRSCATCHPKSSNCGLDVERMDTTFKSPTSPHDIHFVKCADCHVDGVPARRAVE